MHRCQVYKTNREYIIVTSSKNEDWIWVADEPIFRVPVEHTDSKLIETVLEALKRSRIDIPNIPVKDKAAWQKKTLKEMGQSSYLNLYQKSNSCSVSRDENGVIEISPYKPYIPGDFTSGLVVVKEGVVKVDMNGTSISGLERILIDILNHDYKN